MGLDTGSFSAVSMLGAVGGSETIGQPCEDGEEYATLADPFLTLDSPIHTHVYPSEDTLLRKHTRRTIFARKLRRMGSLSQRCAAALAVNDAPSPGGAVLPLQPATSVGGCDGLHRLRCGYARMRSSKALVEPNTPGSCGSRNRSTALVDGVDDT